MVALCTVASCQEPDHNDHPSFDPPPIEWCHKHLQAWFDDVLAPYEMPQLLHIRAEVEAYDSATDTVTKEKIVQALRVDLLQLQQIDEELNKSEVI